ncbi:type II toxin-antitoxin system VapC family toxin [Pyrodictium abyssi]|uniref:Ribonuclease VapC n=1 Tax=Pyrodictium abyssi TaxID=54256 RepID=A0ABM8IZ94_9CREN|nr:type II toxin-antitoxin system VapC family toxin [Pyrodictium abyssi]
MTRRVVVDASVLVKWFVPEEFSDKAEAILNDHLDARVAVAAPSYALLELANALRKYVVRGVMGPGEAGEAFSLLLEMDVEFVEVDGELAREALGYAIDNGVTVYDAYYIVLARRLGTVFYTADEKLLRQLRGREPVARHVSEYGPP